MSARGDGIGEESGQWQRYLESQAQMAAVLHLRRQYRREVQVLTDVIPRAGALGNTYVAAGAYGQLSLAYRYTRDYERSYAALLLAVRMTRAAGRLYASDLAGALSSLEKDTGAAEPSSRGRRMSNQRFIDDARSTACSAPGRVARSPTGLSA